MAVFASYCKHSHRSGGFLLFLYPGDVFSGVVLANFGHLRTGRTSGELVAGSSHRLALPQTNHCTQKSDGRSNRWISPQNTNHRQQRTNESKVIPLRSAVHQTFRLILDKIPRVAIRNAVGTIVMRHDFPRCFFCGYFWLTFNRSGNKFKIKILQNTQKVNFIKILYTLVYTKVDKCVENYLLLWTMSVFYNKIFIMFWLTTK